MVGEEVVGFGGETMVGEGLLGTGELEGVDETDFIATFIFNCSSSENFFSKLENFADDSIVCFSSLPILSETESIFFLCSSKSFFIESSFFLIVSIQYDQVDS